MSNSAFVKSLYEAFGKGDVPTVVGALDPSIRWQLSAVHGHQAVGGRRQQMIR